MNRWPAVVLAVALVLGATPVVVDAPATRETNATEASPGTGVSSVLGVQGTRIGGAIERNALRGRLEAADTPAARARVVAAAVNRTETRLIALEERLATLRATRDGGSMGNETYALRVAPVAANARALRGLVVEISEASEDLDAGTLREAGVTRDRIDRLEARIDRVVAADEGAIGTGGVDRAFYRRIATLAATYNREVAADDLGVLGSYLDGERINLHLVTSDGDAEVVSFRMTEKSRIRDLQAGPHPDATVRVTTNESTARRLVNSSAPTEAANRVFLEGGIRIDGLGLYNAIRWVLINAVIGTIRAFVGLVETVRSLLS